jgi:hypothetical protein
MVREAKMAANDVLSLNLLYEDWCKTRLKDGKAPRNLQPFEYFCADQFLKSFSLNDEELMRGMVGDRHDGGVDTFHFFINRVLADDSTVVDRRSENDVDVIIMQIRETKGFSPTAIDKMERFTDDLLDLQRTPDKYGYGYHQRLIDLMRTFKSKMRGMGHYNLRLEHYFVTRCDESPNTDCMRSAAKIIETVHHHFPKADVPPFHYAGAQSLYDQTNVRRPSKKCLEFIKSFDTHEGWVGLVSLQTFYNFLKDESSKKLNEKIFDDNVRGYYQNTPVNRAITATLSHPEKQAEFWLLNNGITILTPDASLNSGQLSLQDPQIVNGLQTSRRIFDYFSRGNVPSDDRRRILIRVIENEDPEFRDQIIKATNNQNKMAAEALISTSRLHKQLERYFAENDLFYDRRKGHYKDQGKEISKIVSILTLVQAVVAIALRRPNDARGRPRDYVNKLEKRQQVFGRDDYGEPGQGKPFKDKKPFDVAVYLQCVRILRHTDAYIENPTRKLDNIQQRNLRFYLARYIACEMTKNFYCPVADLISPRVLLSAITDRKMSKYLREVKAIYEKNGNDDDAAKGKGMLQDLDNFLQAKYSPPHSSAAN